jgi:hypothetical protein
MSFKITAESDLWESRGTFTLAGRSEFEDGLGSSDFVSGYSYHMSVCTGLPDQPEQTIVLEIKHPFPRFIIYTIHR